MKYHDTKKSCLLLTGHVRGFGRYKQNILGKLVNKNTDIYACTWDDQGDYSISEKYEVPIKKQLILPSVLQGRIKTLTLNPRTDDVFKKVPRAIDHLSRGCVERMKYQWFCVKHAFKMVEDYEQYDVIVRCRFDMCLYDTAPLEYDENKLNIPTRGVDVNLYNDHFAYGNPTIMKKHCTMYDHVQDIYDSHNIDISYNERLLKFYMEEYQVKVSTAYHDIQYTIERITNDLTRLWD